MNPRKCVALLTAVFVGALSAPSAGADAITERLQDRVRKMLDKPYYKAPFGCSDEGWSESKDNYVLDVAPWAAAAGLQRGDRLLAFAGRALSNVGESKSEIWAQVPRSAHVEIQVERNGKEVLVRLPCLAHSQIWQVMTDTKRAIVDGRWQDCIDGVWRGSQITGIAPASTLYVALICYRGKIEAARQPAPEDFLRLLHRWATKAIEESRYRPVGLAEIRGELLSASAGLEKAGRKDLADDLRQQIAGFAQAPPTVVAAPSAKIRQGGGTGFVVRPDGFILTAFHVVKDATEIEVSCPEAPKATAAVGQFSEANDLAVLRLTGNRTPTYLSLGEQRTVAVGDGVFTVGYPAPNLLGGEAKFAEGVISSLSVGGDAGYMQISVPVQPGNSGGALVNRSGEVVGVVIATASALTFLKGTGSLPQNVSWAVKGAFAAPLFDQPPHSPKILDRSAVIQRVVNATCSVKVSVQEDR
jgi:S1-C subfamily serine protease